MSLLANLIWVSFCILVVGCAYAIGHGVGFHKGRRLGHREAVANSEVGIADGLERTDEPRPDAPPAVMRRVDYARGRLDAADEWD